MSAMKLKILGIAGSPREGGNSETLLDWTLEAAAACGAAVEKLRVCDLHISGCRECGGCVSDGKCVIDDDMQKVYQKVLDADWVVVATPMFFMNVPSQLKAFIDRFQCVWTRKFVLGKPLRDESDACIHRGLVLAVGGTKGQSLFTGLNLMMKVFFRITEIEFDERNSLYYKSVDGKGAIAAHETARADAVRVGVFIAELRKD
jgi:multimeric flavodoxin WrbA